jgi:N-acetylmuramoyl-L-alanine amidase
VDGAQKARYGAARGNAGERKERPRLMIALRYAGAALLFALIIVAGDGRQPARSEEHAPDAAAPARSNCQRSAFRVVVDVGHTVEVPGAISARGVPEYQFNLRLAERIKQTLADAGFDKTFLLITATARSPGLFERAARANDMRADLFISIHHDSVPDYLLETWDYEGQQNHFSDRFTGYAIFVSNDNPRRAGSLEFGRFLGKELQASGLHYTPHYTLPLMGRYRRALLDAKAGIYRFDDLVVLQSTHMPAVLFEAGSIVNRQEELELASPERIALTSAAIAAAVQDFCAAHPLSHDNRIGKRPAQGPLSLRHWPAPSRHGRFWPAWRAAPVRPSNVLAFMGAQRFL